MSAKRTRRRKHERDRRQRRAERRSERRAQSGSGGGGCPPGAPKATAPTAPAAPADDALPCATRGVVAEEINDALRWHIARTTPGKGTKALEGLKKASVAVFRPYTSDVVVRRGRRVVRKSPLMMHAVFIGVYLDNHLDLVRRVNGIAEIVSHPEPDTAATGNVPGFVMRPARLDPVMLQGFADRLASGEIVAPVGVRAGDQGIVRSGPFASFPGVVDEFVPCEDPLEPPRLRVSVAIFGRSTLIELGLAEFDLL